ncbi:hypothetical protein CDCA_CDCA03G1036 [Cyanidium caldarium]|uniref:HhH-GPD domain-containing protein n=1 Tax=Cyanidium caldarium TaxID=2771 RepID=A0AAV9IS52_CYACA|nr:hypothetical protein CDCA_CDCA03G1036 [Cyanidium caldarium]
MSSGKRAVKATSFAWAEAPDIRSVHQALVRAYGVRKRPARRRTPEPLLDVLIRTVLSQNTTDALSERAYRQLRQRFSRWSEVLSATQQEVEGAIRVGGLARVRAQHIRDILQRVADARGVQRVCGHEDLSLEHLQAWSTPDVMQALTQHRGVGQKTAACVVLFGLRRDDVFPVDTHIHRVAQRLGWLGTGVAREDTQAALNEAVPDALKYALHLLLIAHGKRVCRARTPRCAECVLAPLGCRWYATADKVDAADIEGVGDGRRGQMSRKRRRSGGTER